MQVRSSNWSLGRRTLTVVALIALTAMIGFMLRSWGFSNSQTEAAHSEYLPRNAVDTSGFTVNEDLLPRWESDASLEDLRRIWKGTGFRAVENIDRALAARPDMPAQDSVPLLFMKSAMLNYEGETKKAYEVLQKTRALVEQDAKLSQATLYSIIFLQGVTALRRGENENCLMCRGESSCILPISKAARHTNPEGSRLAIEHFTEYLKQFPDDGGVRWLLNLAHMTLGEHPDGVDPKYLVSLEYFQNSEFDIGRFRDVGHIVGVNRLNQGGGAIMDDFNNDGLLDIVITAFDPTSQMSLLINTGSGTFEERTEAAGLTGQYGGINCMQTDYNNDGYLDVFISRGAWLKYPMRPSLLRNNKDGKFTDVTEDSGLLHPVNSPSATWADYDNDGWLDLFVCCEQQRCRLYHNLGNGSFEEVATQAGVLGRRASCKGAAWIDFDNDGFQDLFLNYLTGDEGAQLYRNNRDGTFRDLTYSLGIHGPRGGFSCWAWDYDNDGWSDIFATCYDVTLDGVIEGLQGSSRTRNSNRLYRNLKGTGFEDVTEKAGLALLTGTMGSNFGDFDNDGYLDMYLGTGDPQFSTLVPNRMFKNISGRRFAEITASSGTGSLQKGHGVACGDWDRDGDSDIFIDMGGAVNGDKYHNILFQNPGSSNHSLTVKLTGQKSNRAAIGARIKIVTKGDAPQTFYRHVSSGSSFGANPLQQTIGLGSATGIAVLEVYWPTSDTTQSFHDVAMDQAIAITEFVDQYQPLNWSPIPFSVSLEGPP